MAHHNKINCNTCLALVSLFYSSGMSNAVRSAIVYHLIKCDKCLDRYNDYENKHPEFQSVSVKKLIKYLRTNIDESDEMTDSLEDLMEVTSSYTCDSNTDGEHFNPTKWQDAAATFDIETLMNLKFFRDLINSYDYNKVHSDFDYSGFYRYLARKVAKHIDHLEGCLRKDQQEEKKKEKPSFKKIVKKNVKKS